MTMPNFFRTNLLRSKGISWSTMLARILATARAPCSCNGIITACDDVIRATSEPEYHDRGFSYEALLDLVRLLPIRVSKRRRDINGGGQPANEAWVAGLYAHGGWTGVTRRTTRYPQVVRFLNAFMRHHVGDEGESWTSLTLMKNVSTDIHVDCHNQKESTSTTLSFGEFSGGQLWIVDDSVDATACVGCRTKMGNV